jgi:uncharacterized protein (UPF0332 family)
MIFVIGEAVPVICKGKEGEFFCLVTRRQGTYSSWASLRALLFNFNISKGKHSAQLIFFEDHFKLG